MPFTMGDAKKKRGFLLVAEEPAKDAKGGEYSEGGGEESSDGDAELEAAAAEAGVDDLPKFMKFLGMAIERCKQK